MINPNRTEIRHHKKEEFDSIVMGIIKNFEQNSLPDSISILINFGTDKNHVLYDADQVGEELKAKWNRSFVLNVQANHACSCHQIWDPFSKMCHDIFCSTDQV